MKRKETYLGVGIDLETTLRDGDGGDLGDVVVLPLPLLLLELEGDTPDGSLLNPLHEVGGEPSDLVTESLGRDDGNLVGDSLVGAVRTNERREVSSQFEFERVE